MRLLRLQIENFRNFQRIDCRLGRHVVLLGENGAGKSNLLQALRLVLDSDMADSERYLEAEDFWIGVTPFAGNEVLVSVDLTDYEREPSVLACLGDHEVETPQGWDRPVARLTYKYGPRQTIEKEKRPTTTKDDYEFTIYGKDDPSSEVRRDVRRFLQFKLLHALRDAETDLRAWRRSPLRPLLEEVIPTLDPVDLRSVAAHIDEVTDEITGQQALVDLRERIVGRVNEMIGLEHGLKPTLGFASTNPALLLRSLKLFVDAERRWEISETSLGLANVIYLALLLLHAGRQEDENQVAAVLLGIEEPEAHLHPQMQRQVFRDLLRGKRPVLVSTHSPSIASVAPIEALVVLRTDGNKSILKSFADATSFTDQQRADLARYLDVTRAEILFGRGILLVEGDAEEFIVPAAARLLDPAVELDDYGISVCSVAGTDFVPYVKFLRHLGIPHAVITDGDAKDSTGNSASTGIKRALEILAAAGESADTVQREVARGEIAKALRALRGLGIFVGDRTLEADMLRVGAGSRMTDTFREILPQTKHTTLQPFRSQGPVDDAGEEKLIGLLTRPGVGKGRFAQRFADLMVASDIPEHVRAAIKWLISRCKHG